MTDFTAAGPDAACTVLQRWWRRRCICQATSLEFCWLGASGVVLLHGRETDFPTLKIVNAFRVMQQLLTSNNYDLLGTPLHPRSIDLVVAVAMASPAFMYAVGAKVPLCAYGMQRPPPRTPRLRASYLADALAMLQDRTVCIQRDREHRRFYEWVLNAAEFWCCEMLHLARLGKVPTFMSAISTEIPGEPSLREALTLLAGSVYKFSVWAPHSMQPLTEFLTRVHDEAHDPDMLRAPGATDSCFAVGLYSFTLQSICANSEVAQLSADHHSHDTVNTCSHNLRVCDDHYREQLRASKGGIDEGSLQALATATNCLSWHEQGRAAALQQYSVHQYSAQS